MIPPYAPPQEANPQGAPAEQDFDTHLKDLDEMFRRQKAMQRTINGRKVMQDAMRPYSPPPPPSPEAIEANQALSVGMQALQQREQILNSSFQAASQNLDPVQKAALALKLHQNAMASQLGQESSNYLEMPLDPRFALLSASYGGGASALGDPFGGAARILASLGPQASMPRSTLDIFHEMQARRPHKVMVNITQVPPEQKPAQPAKGAK